MQVWSLTLVQRPTEALLEVPVNRFPRCPRWCLHFLMCFGLLPTSNVWADTIYLKNGREIQATSIKRDNGKITFDTAAGTVSLSSSTVDRIVRNDSENREPERLTGMVPQPPQRRPYRTSAGSMPKPRPTQPVSLEVPSMSNSIFVVPLLQRIEPIAPREVRVGSFMDAASPSPASKRGPVQQSNF